VTTGYRAWYIIFFISCTVTAIFLSYGGVFDEDQMKIMILILSLLSAFFGLLSITGVYHKI